MNTIQKIESATLASIAGLCAAAVFSIVFQSAAVAAPAKTSVSALNRASIVQLAPVVIVGKRLTAAQKAINN